MFLIQITDKEGVGTIDGFIFNEENNPSDAPQDSPEGAWLVWLGNESKKILKQYKADKSGWAYDTSLIVAAIEW